MKITLSIDIDLDNNKCVKVETIEEKPIEDTQVVEEPVNEKEEPIVKPTEEDVVPTTENHDEPLVIDFNSIDVSNGISEEEAKLIHPLETKCGRRTTVNSSVRTKEYPFNSGDIKELMKVYRINFINLADVLGMDVIQLRNMFRKDNRRFTVPEYNVIIKAIKLCVENKNIADKI